MQTCFEKVSLHMHALGQARDCPRATWLSFKALMLDLVSPPRLQAGYQRSLSGSH